MRGGQWSRGISNHRLISVAVDAVKFRTKDGNSETIAPEEFIRRFLLHVLPKGFVKIRHYGLLASAHVNNQLQLAHELVGRDPSAQDTIKARDWLEHLLILTGFDLIQCPKCHHGRLVAQPLPRRDTS